MICKASSSRPKKFKKKILTNVITDNEDKDTSKPNAMATTILNHFFEIIGQEEVLFRDVIEAQDKIL